MVMLIFYGFHYFIYLDIIFKWASVSFKYTFKAFELNWNCFESIGNFISYLNTVRFGIFNSISQSLCWYVFLFCSLFWSQHGFLFKHKREILQCILMAVSPQIHHCINQPSSVQRWGSYPRYQLARVALREHNEEQVPKKWQKERKLGNLMIIFFFYFILN